MNDYSSDLELLDKLQRSANESSSEEEVPARQVRRRVQYRLDRSFDTIDEFNSWVDEGNLDGWHKKDTKRLKNGTESIFYE
jgi:hypothetical protein